MRPVRYLITGGSGYIGSRPTEILQTQDDVEGIVNVDVRPPARSGSKADDEDRAARDRGEGARREGGLMSRVTASRR
jgi:nucleoside-diphosphate-sugar epimerase